MPAHKFSVYTKYFSRGGRGGHHILGKTRCLNIYIDAYVCVYEVGGGVERECIFHVNPNSLQELSNFLLNCRV